MPVRCMDFLGKKRRGQPPPFIVLFGDDEFLLRETRTVVREWIIGPEPDDFTYVVHEGSQVQLRDVLDDIFTPPMLGDRRLVVVMDKSTERKTTADKSDDGDAGATGGGDDEADGGRGFVARFREGLQRYLEAPSEQGFLLIEAKTWRSNTKLAKAVEQAGLAIEAKAPAEWHVGAWVVQWANSRYDKKVTKPTADWLVELVGPNLGQLDQELRKLTDFVGSAAEIDIESVNRLVAGARVTSAFRLLDLLLEGKAAKALELLDRQLLAGESPVAVLGMVTAQMRKLTQAARDIVAGASMDNALADSGVPPFAMEKARAQLRHFGRARMAAMYRLLLQTDLDVKGGTALDQRTVVERFLIELAR